MIRRQQVVAAAQLQHGNISAAGMDEAFARILATSSDAVTSSDTLVTSSHCFRREGFEGGSHCGWGAISGL